MQLRITPDPARCWLRGACSLVCRPWQLPGGNFFQGEGYLADVFYPLAYPLLVSPMSTVYSCRVLSCQAALPVVLNKTTIWGLLYAFFSKLIMWFL